MKKRFIDFVEHEVKEFRIVGFDCGGHVDFKFNLDEEYDDENRFEWINAFEQFGYFEAINQLEVGGCLFVKISRDEDQAKGVIMRTK